MTNTDFSIQSFKGGFDNNFSYVLTCMRTGTEIIVDAAIRLETIKPFIKSSPSAILVTHTHKDHIEYINTYIENFPEIKIIGHPESIDIFDKNRFISVSDNSLIKIGNLQLKVIYTPGHYFDSICYFVENVLTACVFGIKKIIFYLQVTPFLLEEQEEQLVRIAM